MVFSTKLWSRLGRAVSVVWLVLLPLLGWGQTPFSLSTGNYSENFNDIASWSNIATNNRGATSPDRFGGVAVNSTGTIPDGVTITGATASFSTGTAKGVQKGTNNLVLLATGSGNNTEAVAVDLFLDFTGRVAGNLSFNWAAVDNGGGTRPGSLRVYTIIGSTFAEITGAAVSYTTATATGTVNVALPTTLNNVASARLRFYCHNPTTSGSGTRIKISLDNLGVSSTSATVTPVVTTTTPVTAITAVAATLGGNITTLGSPAPTANGVVYSVTSTNGTPALLGTGVTNVAASSTATAIGLYTVGATSLTPNTAYSYRAYVTNSSGTVYGGAVGASATTLASVTSTTDTSPGQTTATPGGTVAAGGGASITDRGVFYSLTTPFADGAGTQVSASPATGTGAFTSSLSGLMAGTTYYIKAYATNAGGTSYGSQVSFTTAPAAANTITTGAVTGVPVCATSATPITVAYTITGTITGTYLVELSDVSGNFPGTTLVTTGGTAGSSITATVLAGTTSSTLYKVRVNNDAPATTGSASAAFTIISNTAVTVAGSTPQALTIATGPTTGSALTASSASAVAPAYQWYYSTTPNDAAAAAIGGATAASYTPTVADLGTTAGTYYVSVRATYPGCGDVVGTPEATVTVANPTPVITAAPSSLTGLTYVVGGGPSASQFYNLSGQYLTPAAGNLTVDATGTAYEVSLSSGGSYSATTLLVPYTGSTLTATLIYVRLKAGQAVASYNSQTITNSGGGATAQNVTVSGSVTTVPPTITVTPTSLALGTVAVNTPGVISTYTVSGSALGSTAISITAPAGVELSLNGFVTSASTTLSLSPTAGSVANTTVSVRIAAAASAGSVGTPITNVSGAGSASVTVSGAVEAASTCPSNGFEPTDGTFPGTGYTASAIASGEIQPNTSTRIGTTSASFGNANSYITFPGASNPVSVSFSYARSGSTATRGLNLQASTDGTTFTTIASFPSSNLTDPNVFLVAPVTVPAPYNTGGTVYFRLLKTGTAALLYVDNISVTCGAAAPAFTLATGTPSVAAPYCVGQSPTGDVAFNLPYTVSGGSFGTGNVFTAYLSDATGSFATNKKAVGTVNAVGSGTIAVVLSQFDTPFTLTTASAYRLRVEASTAATANPVLTNNGSNLAVTSYLDNRASTTALAGNGQATLNFTAPATCAQNVVVTIKQGASFGVKPPTGGTATPGVGSGTVVFGTGTDLGGGQYVVYNGPATGSIVVTGLTNGTQYTFGTFVTNGGSTGSTGYSDITQDAVRPVLPATLTEVVLPQYISGHATNGNVGTTHTTRLPYAFRVTIGNLVAGRYYKYYNAAVDATATTPDGPAYVGVGSPIYPSAAGNFTRQTTPSLSGSTATFQADGSGNYTGWFGLDPTGNERFEDGDLIKMRIVVNAGGIDAATALADNVPQYYLTTTSTVQARLLGSGAAQATAVRGNSFGTPKNIVVAYDETTGSARPLAATWVESEGSDATNYATFYPNAVAGAYGLLTPNDNPNGIRRLEQRALADGTLVGCVATDADGTWPGTPANTTSTGPKSGATPLELTSGDTPFAAPTVLENFTASGSLGTPITINGTNFTTGPRPSVSFNGSAPVLATGSSDTSLTVVVPADATTGTLSVTTGCGTVTTAASFTVTRLLAVSVPSLAAFNAVLGTPSAVQSYTLTGSSLVADVTVSAPAGYELAITAGGTYAATLSITPAQALSPGQPVFVRLTGAAAGSFGGDITHASAGAASPTVAVTGTVVATPAASPAPTVSAGSLTSNSTVLTLGAGAGTNLLVVVRLATAAAVVPSNGTTYTASAAYGASGSTAITGAGNFVVFAAANATSVTVTGLTDATSYVADVYTYNTGTAPGFEQYQPLGGTSGVFTTPVILPSAPGVLVLEENFEYPANAVLTATAGSGWREISGGGVTPNDVAVDAASLSFTQYGSPARLGRGVTITDAQDIGRDFVVPVGTTEYFVSALVRVNTSATDYFFSLTPNATTPNYMARIYTKSLGGGQFNFGTGYNNTSTTSAVYSNVVCNTGTTYVVVLRFIKNPGATDDQMELYVLDPAGGVPLVLPTNKAVAIGYNGGTTPPEFTPGAVALRQATTSQSILVDGIRVGTGWGSVVGRPVFSSAGAVINAGNYFDMRVNNGDVVTPAGAVSLENNLTLNSGKIMTTAVNSLTLQSAVTVTGGNSTSFVSGPVQRAVGIVSSTTSFTFPVGKNNAYRPLILNVASQTSTRTYVAEQFNSTARTDGLSGGLTRVSNFRYFSLNPVAASGTFSGTVTLAFGTDDYVNQPQASTFVVAKRPTGGGTWTNIDRTSATGANSPTLGTYVASGDLTSGVFTTFSDFTLASTDLNVTSNSFNTSNPLPVELTRFAATRTAAGPVALTWATATEKNSARFEVQRSLDGREFATIATVAAQGNSTQPTAYATLDKTATAALLYYRLRQVDLDGTSALSPVVTVTGSGAVAKVQLYPNPAHSRISFIAEAATPYRVLNQLGQSLLSGTTEAGTASIGLEALPTGLYFLELQTATGRTVQKFEKITD